MKNNNLVIANYPGPDAWIGEIVREGRTITVLTSFGTYVNLRSRKGIQDLTEEIYNDLSDYRKQIVDNWDHDMMTEIACENMSVIFV